MMEPFKLVIWDLDRAHSDWVQNEVKRKQMVATPQRAKKSD